MSGKLTNTGFGLQWSPADKLHHKPVHAFTKDHESSPNVLKSKSRSAAVLSSYETQNTINRDPKPGSAKKNSVTSSYNFKVVNANKNNNDIMFSDRTTSHLSSEQSDGNKHSPTKYSNSEFRSFAQNSSGSNAGDGSFGPSLGLSSSRSSSVDEKLSRFGNKRVTNSSASDHSSVNKSPFIVSGGPFLYRYSLSHLSLRWSASSVGSEHSLQNTFFPAEVSAGTNSLNTSFPEEVSAGTENSLNTFFPAEVSAGSEHSLQNTFFPAEVSPATWPPAP